VFAFLGKAGPIGIDDEGADPATGSFCEGNDGRSDAAVGNQVLDPVEDELVPLSFVGHLHFEGIAAGLRLRETKGEYLLGLGTGREPTAPLFLVAPHPDRVRADGGMTGKEGPHSGPLLPDARQGPNISGGVHAAAAVGHRDRHGQNAVLAGQRNHLIVEAVLDIAKLLARANLLAELFHVCQQAIAFGIVHVQGSILLWIGRSSDRRSRRKSHRLRAFSSLFIWAGAAP
jgi:hypothetical protein